MACIELYDTGQNCHAEKQVFGYPWLQNKFRIHSLK